MEETKFVLRPFVRKDLLRPKKVPHMCKLAGEQSFAKFTKGLKHSMVLVEQTIAKVATDKFVLLKSQFVVANTIILKAKLVTESLGL